MAYGRPAGSPLHPIPAGMEEPMKRTVTPPQPSPTSIITFSPPQPCCVRAAYGQRCPNMATVGVFWPNADGTFTVQPICKACAEATARNYTEYTPA